MPKIDNKHAHYMHAVYMYRTHGYNKNSWDCTFETSGVHVDNAHCCIYTYGDRKVFFYQKLNLYKRIQALFGVCSRF